MGNVGENDIIAAVDTISNQLGLDSSVVRCFSAGQLKCPLRKLAKFVEPFASQLKADPLLLACIMKISFWDEDDVDMDADEQIEAAVVLAGKFLHSANRQIQAIGELAAGDDETKVLSAKRSLCEHLCEVDADQLTICGRTPVDFAFEIGQGEPEILDDMLDVMGVKDQKVMKGMVHLFINKCDEEEDFDALEEKFRNGLGQCTGILRAIFGACTYNLESMTIGLEKALGCEVAKDALRAKPTASRAAWDKFAEKQLRSMQAREVDWSKIEANILSQGWAISRIDAER